MKNKGFTLMELIAVIVLLGLITLIISVPINKILKDAKTKLNNHQKEQIELAAELWAVDNPYLLPPYTEDKSKINVTIEQLLSEGYFDTEIVNLINKKIIKKCSYVSVTLSTQDPDSTKNVYTYEFVEVDECQ